MHQQSYIWNECLGGIAITCTWQAFEAPEVCCDKETFSLSVKMIISFSQCFLFFFMWVLVYQSLFVVRPI